MLRSIEIRFEDVASPEHRLAFDNLQEWAQPHRMHKALSTSGDLSLRLIGVKAPEEASTKNGRVNGLIDAASKPFHRPLTWLWRRGFRFLFIFDAVVLILSMSLINFSRFGTNWPTYPLRHYLIGFAIATAIQLSVNYFSGLYERESELGSRPWLPRVSLAMTIGVAMGGLAALVTDRYLMPRLNIAALLIIGTVALTSTRYLSRSMASQRQGPAKLALVGTHSDCALSREIIEADDSPLLIVCESRSMSDLHDSLSFDDLTDVLILDLETMAETPVSRFEQYSEAGVGLHQRIASHETMLGLRSVSQISGIPFTRLQIEALSSHQSRLKRILDISIVLLVSPLLAVVLAATALYVRVNAGSGVIYRQNRIGHLGKDFQIVKFRTMIKEAESSTGPRLSHDSDSRVIPSLRCLRSSRLDELPQIWNVLRGEMSLVGPRPERPEFVEEIAREVPGYRRRHSVKPGLTGLAQVHGRYDSEPVHKLGYDLQYLANWSPVLDVQVLVRTIWVVLTRRV